MSLVCVSAGRVSRSAPLLSLAALAAAALSFAAPQAANAQASQASLAAAIQAQDDASRDVRAFYRARGYRPMWIDAGGNPRPAALHLLDLVGSAELDGLDRRRFRSGRLEEALDRAHHGSPKAIAQAETLFSETFAAYVQGMRRGRGADMRYESEALAPVVPTQKAALEAAAAAPSLDHYVQSMGWMHPFYAPLRRALADPMLDGRTDALLRLNLERVSAIPHTTSGRYVLVDAAGARLWMFENGRVRDSMRVVVGKADQQTPMMAGFIRYAIMNPYWNVPPDLVPSKVAPGVLKQGPAYLKANRYEVLSDWSDNARTLDPALVDWRAVAAGRQELRVRQLPGRTNSMGSVKFMFPNDLGIYLHDTPDKQLMKRANRQFSSGCVRLEDAARLGRWLFGKPLVAPSAAPEQQVNLPEPVPVYITYLTAAPEAERIAYRADIYGRDRTALAQVGAGSRGTR